jgi:predicted DNA-binding protein with PD1-like motif
MIILSFKKGRQKYSIKAKKGEELLVALDKFLKKNKIKYASIKDWQLEFFQEKSIISKRIAQSILHALKITT